MHGLYGYKALAIFASTHPGLMCIDWKPATCGYDYLLYMLYIC